MSTNSRLLLFREIPALLGLVFFLLVPMAMKHHFALFSVAYLYSFVVTSDKIKDKILLNKKYKFSFLKMILKIHLWGESALTFSGQWNKGNLLALWVLPIVWVSLFQLVLGITGAPWGAIVGATGGFFVQQTIGPLMNERANT